MLNNIPKNLSPELVKTLMEMGHGDEIVIADGNFPGAVNDRIVRADGHGVPEILSSVLELFPLDTYSDWQVGLMKTVGDDPTPPVWKTYDQIVKEKWGEYNTRFFERFEFYEQAKDCFAVVITSETALYGNIIIKKGVVA